MKKLLKRIFNPDGKNMSLDENEMIEKLILEGGLEVAGIDTPESRTTDKVEKALGLESKEYLKKQLKDAKRIVIRTEKMNSSEKYGRILGWLYINGDSESINNKMISDGYAWGYLGETKIKDFAVLKEARAKFSK